MITTIQQKKTTFSYRVFSCLLAFTFLFSSLVPPQRAQAQGILNLPLPGVMVPLSPAYHPAMIKGIHVHPTNPLEMDFIIDSGDTHLDGQDFNREATKLIKYFLSSLTLKEEEMWVNLSPYEKDRMIPEAFGHTEMGRDLLIQDYLLKQLTASLIYPEDELGQKFWKRVYAKAQEQFGTTEIPMNTFNKIWIIPESAQVFEHDKGAFVVSSHLKVMLEEDYLALEHHDQKLKKEKAIIDARSLMLDASAQNPVSSIQHPASSIQAQDTRSKEIVSGVSSEIIREVLIPEIEKEINEGQTFANLRQIFNSMILATWYKQNLKESLLSQVYVNQNKIKGVELDDPSINTQIYDQYVEAFKKGVFNYIKEDIVVMESQQDSTATSRLSFEAKHEQNLAKEEAPARDDPNTQEMIPRKYFSGGVAAKLLPEAVKTTTASSALTINNSIRGPTKVVSARFNPETSKLSVGQLDELITFASSPVEKADLSSLHQSLILANEQGRRNFIEGNPHFEELIAAYQEDFERLAQRHSYELFSDIYDWTSFASGYFFGALLPKMIKQFPEAQLDLLLPEFVDIWKKAENIGELRSDFFHILLDVKILYKNPKDLEKIAEDFMDLFDLVDLEEINLFYDLRNFFDGIDDETLTVIWPEFVRLVKKAGQKPEDTTIDDEFIESVRRSLESLLNLSDNKKRQKFVERTIQGMSGIKDKLKTGEDVIRYGEVMFELVQELLKRNERNLRGHNDYTNYHSVVSHGDLIDGPSGIALASPFIHSPEELRIWGLSLIDMETKVGNDYSNTHYLFKTLYLFKGLYDDFDGFSRLANRLITFYETSGHNALASLMEMWHLVTTWENLEDVIGELDSIFKKEDTRSMTDGLKTFREFIQSIPDLRTAGEKLTKIEQKAIGIVGEDTFGTSVFNVMRVLVDDLEDIEPLADEILALQGPDYNDDDPVFAGFDKLIWGLEELRNEYGNEQFRQFWPVITDLIRQAGIYAPDVIAYGLKRVKHIVHDAHSFRAAGNQLILLAQKTRPGETYLIFSEGLATAAALITKLEDIGFVGVDLIRMRDSAGDGDSIRWTFGTLGTLRDFVLIEERFRQFWPILVDSAVEAGGEAWKIIHHGFFNFGALLNSDEAIQRMSRISLRALQQLRYQGEENYRIFEDGVKALQHLIIDMDNYETVVEAFVLLENRFAGRERHFYKTLGPVLRKNKRQITSLNDLNGFMDRMYAELNDFSEKDYKGTQGGIFDIGHESKIKNSLRIFDLVELPDKDGLKQARNTKIKEMFHQQRHPEQIKVRLNLREGFLQENPDYKRANDELRAIIIAFSILLKEIQTGSSPVTGQEADLASSPVSNENAKHHAVDNSGALRSGRNEIRRETPPDEVQMLKLLNNPLKDKGDILKRQRAIEQLVDKQKKEKLEEALGAVNFGRQWLGLYKYFSDVDDEHHHETRPRMRQYIEEGKVNKDTVLADIEEAKASPEKHQRVKYDDYDDPIREDDPDEDKKRVLRQMAGINDYKGNVEKFIEAVREIAGQEDGVLKDLADSLENTYQSSNVPDLIQFIELFETEDYEKVRQLQTNLENINNAIVNIMAFVEFSRIVRSDEYAKASFDDERKAGYKNGWLFTEYKKGQVQNDAPEDIGLTILTGSNMSGKSHYLQQNYFVQLLAQSFGYVPAEEANIHIYDHIVYLDRPSTDSINDLSAFGKEIDNWLPVERDAGPKTIVFVDEGYSTTSPEDQAKFLHASDRFFKNRGSNLMVATHNESYIEAKEGDEDTVFYHFVIEIEDKKVSFTYKRADGPDDSHALEVARTQGLDESLIKRAENYLEGRHKPVNPPKDRKAPPVERYSDEEREALKREKEDFQLFFPDRNALDLNLQEEEEEPRGRWGHHGKESQTKWRHEPVQDMHGEIRTNVKVKSMFSAFSEDPDFSRYFQFPKEDFKRLKNHRIVEAFREIFRFSQTRDPKEIYERQKMFEELMKLDIDKDLNASVTHILRLMEALSNPHFLVDLDNFNISFLQDAVPESSRSALRESFANQKNLFFSILNMNLRLAGLTQDDIDIREELSQIAVLQSLLDENKALDEDRRNSHVRDQTDEEREEYHRWHEEVYKVKRNEIREKLAEVAGKSVEEIRKYFGEREISDEMIPFMAKIQEKALDVVEPVSAFDSSKWDIMREEIAKTHPFAMEELGQHMFNPPDHLVGIHFLHSILNEVDHVKKIMNILRKTDSVYLHQFTNYLEGLFGAFFSDMHTGMDFLRKQATIPNQVEAINGEIAQLEELKNSFFEPETDILAVFRGYKDELDALITREKKRSKRDRKSLETSKKHYEEYYRDRDDDDFWKKHLDEDQERVEKNKENMRVLQILKSLQERRLTLDHEKVQEISIRSFIMENIIDPKIKQLNWKIKELEEKKGRREEWFSYENYQAISYELFKFQTLLELASILKNQEWTASELTEEMTLDIEEGWNITKNKKDQVPLTMHLGTSERIRLIAGANMSGKTFSEKTMIWNVLMAMATGFAPNKGMQLPIFSRVVYIDRVTAKRAEELSSFGHEIEYWKAFFKHATEGTNGPVLILAAIDEAGSTTSPRYQGALSYAITEANLEMGNFLVMASHHHQFVNDFADTNPDHVKVYHLETHDDEKGEIVFDYEVAEGDAPSDSLRVAKKQGLKEIIKFIDSNEGADGSVPASSPATSSKHESETPLVPNLLHMREQGVDNPPSSPVDPGAEIKTLPIGMVFDSPEYVQLLRRIIEENFSRKKISIGGSIYADADLPAHSLIKVGSYYFIHLHHGNQFGNNGFMISIAVENKEVRVGHTVLIEGPIFSDFQQFIPVNGLIKDESINLLVDRVEIFLSLDRYSQAVKRAIKKDSVEQTLWRSKHGLYQMLAPENIFPDGARDANGIKYNEQVLSLERIHKDMHDSSGSDAGVQTMTGDRMPTFLLASGPQENPIGHQSSVISDPSVEETGPPEPGDRISSSVRTKASSPASMEEKKFRKFMAEYQGVIYYPAAGEDVMSLVALAKKFPKVKEFVFADNLSPSGMFMRQITARDRPAKIKSEVKRSIQRSPVGSELDRVSAQVVSDKKFQLNLTFKKDNSVDKRLRGRKIVIHYRITDLFSVSDKFNVIYVQVPDWGGGLSKRDSFWEKIHHGINVDGYLLVSNLGTHFPSETMFQNVGTVEDGSRIISVYKPIAPQGSSNQIPGVVSSPIKKYTRDQKEVGSNQAEVIVTKKAESSLVSNEAKKGGIDFNPNNLDIQTQGGRFDFKLPLDSIDLQNIHIDGFTPVIINVTPLVNLPLLLGLVDEERDAPKNANHTPKRDPVNHKEEHYLKVSSLN